MDGELKIAVVVLILGLTVGLALGVALGCSMERIAAIENRAAEWRVDPKTGETTFTWLTGKDAKP